MLEQQPGPGAQDSTPPSRRGQREHRQADPSEHGGLDEQHPLNWLPPGVCPGGCVTKTS